MQYSYKDLYQTCQLDSIRGHIQGTLRLAKLIGEFMADLSRSYDRFSKDLEDLVRAFQQRTAEELLQPKDRKYFEKGTLLAAWERLLSEVSHDSKMHGKVSTHISGSSVMKLKHCVDFKQSQLAEMCSFRNKLNRMSDTAAEELHKWRVELRQESLSYEHYRDYYSASKQNDKEKAYHRCVSTHNEYVIQLTSYNKLLREYNSRCVPQTLQELESLHTEAMVTVADSIQAVSLITIDQARTQIDRYDGLTTLCKSVSPSSDISKFVKAENPTPNNFQHNLHSFVPVLKQHQHTPPGLLKCRVMRATFNEQEIAERKQGMMKELSEIESYSGQKELELKGIGEAQIRVHGNCKPSKLYELQLDACKRRNELNMLSLRLAIYRCQLGTLTIGDKTNGEAKDMLTDTTSSKSTNSSQGGGGKSIKAMWKRFAFKATKGQTAGSLPTSENSNNSTSEDSQPTELQMTETKTNDSVATGEQTDPVYALLRCAASIRKNSSMDDSSGVSSMRSRQNTASFDISNSSRSPSPTAVRKTSSQQPRQLPNGHHRRLMQMKSYSLDEDDGSYRFHISDRYKSSSYSNTNVSRLAGESSSAARSKFPTVQQGRGWSADIDGLTRNMREDNLYVMLYDFYKRESGDLPLRAGDRVRVVEKAPSGWWLAENNGDLGYFPGRYALPLRPGQQVYQVASPVNYNTGDGEFKLLKDQVVIQCGPEEDGYITVETDCIRSGHVQGVLCPTRNLVQI